MMVEPDFIGDIELFKGLPTEVLTAVAGLAQPESFEENHVIFEEGDPGDKLYLIAKGSVRISKKVPNAGEEALAVLEEGAYFGEMSLVDGAPRSAFAIAHEGVTLFSIGRTEFHSMLRADPDLAYHILMGFVKTMAHRLRETNERVKSFLAFSMWS